MVRNPLVQKWLYYCLALLPLVFLDGLILSRIPFYGGRPFLLPLAVSVVAVWEGANAGAAYGLYAGVFASLLGHGSKGAMVFLLSLLGAAVGYAFRYGIQQSFLGCLVGSIGALFALCLLRMIYNSIFYGAFFFGMFRIAAPELLWSLLCFPLVYWLYRMVQRRVGSRAYGRGGVA